ncbi:disulfide bond formation protein B [Shewanella sp. JM162201]|uniref:Disulfide bond formation protein B n=1 Tax=Shewanella jiangmenensis TaxID=2837387 RepID=A0ABS5UZJ2_9GAMM|nr:disulfide bond formation protein B [Shewanella jiangmenensis]MBT1443595.1 disulfide bond formation protein B [Shewanella jiangmenensis]
MSETLSRHLNALGALAVSLVLLFAFYSQFVDGDLPCPLCLLQRIGFVAVLMGLCANVVFGPHPKHYAMMIIGALIGGAIALRQVALHVIPGTPFYGDAFFGYHFYTWAFIVFGIIIFGSAIIMSFGEQYQHDVSSTFAEQSPFLKFSVAVVFVVILLNLLSTFAECGPLVCPDNPTEYWLFS